MTSIISCFLDNIKWYHCVAPFTYGNSNRDFARAVTVRRNRGWLLSDSDAKSRGATACFVVHFITRQGGDGQMNKYYLVLFSHCVRQF